MIIGVCKINKLKIAVAVVLMVGLVWCATSWVKDLKDPLNKFAAFVYSDSGILYWFELISRNGHVEGVLHQQKIVKEAGRVPFIEEKKYPLDGEATERGYVFRANKGGNVEIFNAQYSGASLLVQKQGTQDAKSYKGVNQKRFNGFVKRIKKELQVAIDQSEEKERLRLKNFFTELDHVYGYLYSAENGSLQLFIKIEEDTHEGELAGSLLMMEKNPYKKTSYVVNGITDGLMVLFVVTVDGREETLKGNFFHGASDFNLSFWTTKKKLVFHAVTEEKFKQSYEEFKRRAQK